MAIACGRVIVGDVRGKGLDAILLARHVLSAFRRSAVAMPALEQVAGDVSRLIRPHLGEEDFVTAALVQLRLRRRAHHCQLRPSPAAAAPLRRPAAADRREGPLPLGLDDDFTAFTARWSPGDRLLLYTDGLVESRDQHGDFLPQDQIATALAAADCDRALDTLLIAVHRHTRGHGHDDMALLLLEHGASPSGVNGHPAAPTAATAVTAPRNAPTSHERARADLTRMSPESELMA